MSKKKYKKDIRFWEQFKNTIIDKCACENIKKIKRRYNEHKKKRIEK